MHSQRFYTLSASCPDRVGIVARVSGFIAEHKGWILETSLHAELPQNGEALGRYFMRIEIKADSLPFHLAEFRERYLAVIDSFNWNKLIYESHYRFEPIIGETYYLYDVEGRHTLSMIAPEQWHQRWVGSFRLNSDARWEPVKTAPDFDLRNYVGD